MSANQAETLPPIYCACGCGNEVERAKFPSLQRKYINTHQHRGANNGNYKGGKVKAICPICGDTFEHYANKPHKTCGKDDCYKKWQGLKTSSRGVSKTKTTCSHCGKTLYKWPSQLKEKNYCNLYCLAAANPKKGNVNGNWRGGKYKFIREQVLIRDNHKCVICGFDYKTNVHHITPVKSGGTNEFSNLITLCPNHHAMADDGLLNLEAYRNFTWSPISAIAGIPTTTDRANHLHRRSSTRRDSLKSPALPPPRSIREQAVPSDNSHLSPP